MSSIFSDPGFRRGTTLCSGDLTGTGSGNDLPGTELVGQIKVFQDVNPSTGARFSNRLVYCQAVRYLGSDVADGSTVAGLVYTVDLAHENGKPFATITSATTNANVAAGREYGVLDEYLTGNLKQNDVVWIVRKGPSAVKQAAATAIVSGAQLELTGSAGKVQALASGTSIGIQIVGASTAATADTSVRVSLIGDDI